MSLLLEVKERYKKNLGEMTHHLTHVLIGYGCFQKNLSQIAEIVEKT